MVYSFVLGIELGNCRLWRNDFEIRFKTSLESIANRFDALAIVSAVPSIIISPD
jgi:hypothetical protein